MAELTESIRGIRESLRGAAPGPWRASYDEVNGYWVVGGSAAGEVAEVYGKEEALLLCAARNLLGPLLDEREVIVAATRRQVAEEIRALICCTPENRCCCCDDLDQAAAAIARGRGETDGGHAANGPQDAATAPTAPPGGVRTYEGHGDAQEAVG